MKLTRAGEYAVRTVLYLGTAEPGRVVPRREVAQAMDIPHEFLGKVAQDLSRAGIIRIERGAKGGYRLIPAPADVNLLDVVEAVEGEILLNDCIGSKKSCSRSLTCPVHPVWAEARGRLRLILAQADFATLAGRAGAALKADAAQLSGDLPGDKLA